MWHNKPYYSLDAYCKNTFGKKYYKIAINAGLTCPNRDGSLDTRGCIFCSRGGSGDFAVSRENLTISEQIEAGLALMGNKKTGDTYIAYFQAFTNTYGPLDYLETIYREALSSPLIGGISIATRPDCMSEEIVTLLQNLQQEFSPKFIWIELGLQTIHEETARFIRRGYPLDTFTDCAKRLSEVSIPYIVHTILGLPGETHEQIYATINYINQLKPFGIKLQLLHILKGTALALLPDITTYSLEEYIEVVIGCLERLSPQIVVHRLTGDGAREDLIAPLWSLNKRNVLNTLHKTMKEQKTYQGRCYHDSGCFNAL